MKRIITNTRLDKLLQEKVQRSPGNSDKIVSTITNQSDFDNLFQFLFHKDRIAVKLAIDAIEKICRTHPEYLSKWKKDIFQLCDGCIHKEVKWHLALLLPRLKLSKSNIGKAWKILSDWAMDRNNSRIVRANSVQALYELLQKEKDLYTDFLLTTSTIETKTFPPLMPG